MVMTNRGTYTPSDKINYCPCGGSYKTCKGEKEKHDTTKRHIAWHHIIIPSRGLLLAQQVEQHHYTIQR